jgi:predicted ATP-grasp superfamily ATP-dependent carboligase
LTSCAAVTPVPVSGLSGRAAATPTQGRWLLKPLRSSGGIAIRFAEEDEWTKPRRGMYLQEHVAGEAASAVFLAAGGRSALLGATRQLLGQDFGLGQPFLYVGSLGPLVLNRREADALASLGAALASRFTLRGLFNVDFVRTPRGIWPVEVNPRYSASVEVLERIVNKSFIRLHHSACRGGRLPLRALGLSLCAETTAVTAFPSIAQLSVPSSGKAVVYATRDCLAPQPLEQIAADWNQPGQPPGMADIPRPGELLRTGQPVVTVFADGPSLAEVERELRRRVSVIQQVLAAGDACGSRGEV